MEIRQPFDHYHRNLDDCQTKEISEERRQREEGRIAATAQVKDKHRNNLPLADIGDGGGN